MIAYSSKDLQAQVERTPIRPRNLGRTHFLRRSNHLMLTALFPRPKRFPTIASDSGDSNYRHYCTVWSYNGQVDRHETGYLVQHSLVSEGYAKGYHPETG